MLKVQAVLFGCNGVLVNPDSGFAVKNIIQTLEQLKEIPKAVCSNTKIDKLDLKISTINSKHYFELMVGAGKNPKPHPEVFLKGAAGLRANIHNCLAVENSVVGLKAVIASGAISVAYAPTEQAQKELGALYPEFMITDMLDLVELYDQLNEE